MNLDVHVVAVFMLVLARTSAWVMAAPVFGGRGMAGVGRLALAIALSLFIAPLAAPTASVPSDVLTFAILMIGQVLVGLLLGWATGLIVAAFESAGSMIDLSSGFAVASLIDPMTGNQGATFARFANLLFVALLFTTNAYQAIIAGFVRSFEGLPPDLFPSFDSGAAIAAGQTVGNMLLAAVEIGAPVLGALFLTEVALGLAARFAPQANVFLVGLPLKVLVALLALGAALTFFPTYVERLVDDSVRFGPALFD